MKKWILITVLLSMLNFAGCDEMNSDIKTNSIIVNSDSTNQNIDIVDIEYYYNTEWENVEFPIDLNNLNCFKNAQQINTKQQATVIADKILKEYKELGKCLNHSLTTVIFASKDNVWCFEYSLNTPSDDVSNLIDGDCFYVVINGYNGSFISAWAEE